MNLIKKQQNKNGPEMIPILAAMLAQCDGLQGSQRLQLARQSKLIINTGNKDFFQLIFAHRVY